MRKPVGAIKRYFELWEGATRLDYVAWGAVHALCLAAIVCFMAVSSSHTSKSWAKPEQDIREIANSYFRIGEQAALIALKKAQDKGFNPQDGFPSMMNIDDHRIFREIKALYGDGMCGLDTSYWGGEYGPHTNRPPHILTILAK